MGLHQLRALLRDVTTSLRGHDLVLYAAGLTFYATIAVVPLLLIAVYMASVILGEQMVAALGGELADYLSDQLGLADGLRALTSEAPRLSPLALLAALVPATTYGEGLARTLNRLAYRSSGGGKWGRDQAPSVGGLHTGIVGRLKALAVVAGLPVVVLLGLLAVAVLPDLLGLGQAARLVGIYATFWVGWISSSLLLAIVYRLFAPAPLGAGPLFWGSAATGSFLAGMSLGWVQFLDLGVTVGQAYGGSTTVGAMVLAAVYVFLVQLVLLVGYVLTLRLAARIGHRMPTDTPSTADELAVSEPAK